MKYNNILKLLVGLFGHALHRLFETCGVIAVDSYDGQFHLLNFSYKVRYWTDLYNVLYGFGGIELMQYDYTDEEWTKYVDKQGGTLSYE